jgi:hypothetical protein
VGRKRKGRVRDKSRGSAASACPPGGGRGRVAGGGAIRAFSAETLDPAGPPVPAATPRGRRGTLKTDYISSNGSRIVTWDDPKTLSVWDLTTGRRAWGPARHSDPGPLIFENPAKLGDVSDATLSADGRRVAAAIETTGTLTAWDVESGRMLHHSKVFRGYVRCLGFSDDVRSLLLFASDSLVQLFDAESGQRLGPVVRQSGRQTAAGMSRDGRRLAIHDEKAEAIRVIDALRGERLLSLRFGNLPIPISLQFDSAGDSVVFRFEKRDFQRFPLPRFELSEQDTPDLLRFLTGQEIDEADGIGFIDQSTFIKDPQRYQNVFQAWLRMQGRGN